MHKQQQSQTIEPLELTIEQLEQASGGLPKGGWGPAESNPDPEAETASLTTSTDPITLPKGGW